MTSTTVNGGLCIWEKVQTTDPAYTKPFTGAFGFEGTAVNPTYIVRKATEVFGPVGLGWGFDVIHEEYVKGAAIGFTQEDGPVHTLIHKAKVELWYMQGEKKGVVRQFGGTTFVGRGPDGKVYTDEDAAKKSTTDGLLKCLSLLGFGGDIHLGLYDDNKYVQGIEAYFAQQGAGVTDTRQLATNGQPPQEVRSHAQRYSDRYLQWKDRLKKGIKEEELPRTREVIAADAQLSEVERALLLGSKELKCKANHAQSSSYAQDDTETPTPAQTGRREGPTDFLL